ncbi:MAG: diguanylate cyclase [Gammaproteobacteria bacterium]|nr:diguanylate cyclase [Gammaproteobacteria bacterium]NNF62324.1 diguanylate cyclase [Gammaproteobacteria bacterium]NNM20888.1 diguanylate cyclase [Gammaproteobacteria bacterium]
MGARVVTTIFFLSFAAAARADAIGALTAVGNARSWATVSILLFLLLALSLSVLLGVRRSHRTMEKKFVEMERVLSRHEKTEMILKEAHEELEVRVRDRTADLEMSYHKLNQVRDSLAAANDRLISLARVDELTGIANRRQFDETLNIEIKRNIRAQRPVSLILAELDFFGHYRRTYGRDRGDEAFKKIATAVSRTFKRAPDVVARYDDQSFGIILPATEVRDAMRFAERMRQVVFQLCIPHSESEVADRVTLSVGIATMQPDKLYQPADLVAASTRALDAAQQHHNAIEYDAIRSEPVEA